MNERHKYTSLISFIILLLIFLFSRDSLILFLVIGLIGVIFSETLMKKKYDPKIFNLVLAPFLVFQGLILVYTYLFQLKSHHEPSYVVLFYVFVLIWVVVVLLYSYFYFHRLLSKTKITGKMK